MFDSVAATKEILEIFDKDEGRSDDPAAASDTK
jgi:hypothetical protein